MWYTSGERQSDAGKMNGKIKRRTSGKRRKQESQSLYYFKRYECGKLRLNNGNGFDYTKFNLSPN